MEPLDEDDLEYLALIEFRKKIENYSIRDKENKYTLYKSWFTREWYEDGIRENILKYIYKLLKPRCGWCDFDKIFNVKIIRKGGLRDYLDEHEFGTRYGYIKEVFSNYEIDGDYANKTLNKAFLQIYEKIRNPLIYDNSLIFFVDYALLSGKIHSAIYDLFPQYDKELLEEQLKVIFEGIDKDPLNKINLTEVKISCNPFTIAEEHDEYIEEIKDKNKFFIELHFDPEPITIPKEPYKEQVYKELTSGNIKDENVNLQLVKKIPIGTHGMHIVSKYLTSITDLINIEKTCKYYRENYDFFKELYNPIPLTTINQYKLFEQCIKGYQHYKELDLYYALKGKIKIYFETLWKLQLFYNESKNERKHYIWESLLFNFD